MSSKGINALTDLPNELHRVYDNKRNEYWSNSSGKSVWNNPGHAKNAWNSGESVNVHGDDTSRNYIYGKFSEQQRFTIHSFRCTGWELESAQIPMELAQ